ncbi:MAG: phosphoadenylyl-sulfate reductase [Pseudomonadota bacterium]|jgi:phosphoadenosine phosphosulfate reductase
MRLLNTAALADFHADELSSFEAGEGRANGGGLRVRGDVGAGRLKPHLGALERVVVEFPAFRDGRGLSLAAQLREQGYEGELIATGDLLPDQAQHLKRVGFDAVALNDDAVEGEWTKALSTFSLNYQPTARSAAPVWQLRRERHLTEAPADRVKRLNAQFRTAPAAAILEAAIRDAFEGRIAVLSSFGAEAAIILHLVSKIDPATPVVFLDTDRHFAPTLQYRDALVKRLGLTDVRILTPDVAEAAAEDADGNLWAKDTDACCALRKVRPLARVRGDFDAMITGRKRLHGGGRLHLPVFEVQDGQVKVNPLANWTAEQVEAYFEANNLPRHPLVEGGYSSIGCWPCTKPSAGGAGDRSGRWADEAREECGIHLPFEALKPAAA